MTGRVDTVILVLPGAVLDVSPLYPWIGEGGPVSLIGHYLFEQLHCSAESLSYDSENRVLLGIAQAAVEKGIRVANLDYFNPSDPDGHFDNRGLAQRLRSRVPELVEQLLSLRAHPECAEATRLLVSRGIRVGVIPLLGWPRTHGLLAASGVNDVEALRLPDLPTMDQDGRQLLDKDIASGVLRAGIRAFETSNVAVDEAGRLVFPSFGPSTAALSSLDPYGAAAEQAGVDHVQLNRHERMQPAAGSPAEPDPLIAGTHPVARNLLEAAHLLIDGIENGVGR